MQQDLKIDGLYEKLSKDVFDIDSKVDVFITKPLSHRVLRVMWESIRNDIAEKQRFLTDEFERWNHYLFYLADEEAIKDIALKYQIEHDTISSRKIVISAKEYGEYDFNVVISRYIKYSFDEDVYEEMDDFHKDPVVIKLVRRV